MIPESLLQFIWKNRLITAPELRLAGGELLKVVQPGLWNFDAGPDFLDARLELDGTRWAGNVEVHVKASDWYRHGHQHDPAYRNVVLHVVWEADEEVLHYGGSVIPVLVLSRYVSEALLEAWKRLQMEKHPIPCRAYRFTEEPFYSSWLDRMLIERLERRGNEHQQVLEQCKGDWDTAFYQVMARAFGFRVNSEPFALLAQNIPLSLVRRYHESHFQLEALYLGQSGLVNQEAQDPYTRSLFLEYAYLRKVHQLRPMKAFVWKKARMRPVNFPAVRIVQFAHLMAQWKSWSHWIEQGWDGVEPWLQWLDVKPEGYWQTHYHPDQASVAVSKHLGRGAASGIVLNAIAPFLITYARLRGEPYWQDKALKLLERLEAEDNRHIRAWKSLGVEVRHAGASQALLHLYRQYCEPGRCLDCGVAFRLLNDAGKAGASG